MTKLIPLIMLCLMLTAAVLHSQSNTGKFTFSTGIGLVPTYYGKETKTLLPAISIQAGYKFNSKFELSGFLGKTHVNSTPRALSDGLVSRMDNKTTVMGLRGVLNKSLTSKLDMYGGAMIGYASFDLSEIDNSTGEIVVRNPDSPTPYNPNAPDGGFVYAGFIGMKYSFHPVFGVYTEVGYGISLLNAGLAIQL